MLEAVQPSLPRSLLAAVHMAGEIASSMISRPISFGNSTYIDECLESLRAIHREVVRSAGSGPAAHLISTSLGGFLAAPSAMAAQWLVRFIARIEDSAPGRDEACYGRMAPAVLPGKRYRRIIVMTGPGIGVGDEVALFPFVTALQRRFPSARLEIYSFFPGIWRTLTPGSQTHNLVGRPLRAYQQIDSCAALGTIHEALILFTNFAGQKMFLPYYQHRCPADLLEVAVGRGMAWWIPGDGGPAARHCALDPSVPNQSRALEDLLTHLLGRRHRAVTSVPAISRRSAENGAPFRVVLNPLTSKRIPLTPADWAGYVQILRQTLPPERDLSCRVYPGLSSPASDFAEEIVRLCRQRGVLAARDRIGLLTSFDGAPLDSATAIHTVHRMVERADFLLSLDTFTAHLAAYTATPSLTLCLTRNPEFWEQAVNTLWVDLNVGDSSIHSLIRLLVQITLGERNACSILDREQCRKLRDLGPPRSLVHCLLDLFEVRYRHWLAAMDAVWDALLPPVQKLLAQVDHSYSWPALRKFLGTGDASVEDVRRALAKVESSTFFRLACLAGRGPGS